MIRMQIAFGLNAFTVALLCSTQLVAQVFEISSESGFVYFPSPEGPGISGCLANDFRCDFGISGTIGVEATDTSLSFRSANFVLSGNQSIQASPPYPSALVTASNVNSVLVDQIGSLPLLSTVGGTRTYGSPSAFFSLEASITGNELRVTGGRDDTPIDGDGYTFDVATTAVPEPNGTALLITALVAAWAIRRHS